MAEKDLAHTFRDHMKRYGHCVRIENAAGAGTCDVNICIRATESWIELKQLVAWPARATTPVAVPHYTPQQRNWHRARAAAGGRVYVLLQVAREYLLLAGSYAAARLGAAPRAELTARALVYGAGKFPEKDMIAELTAVTPYKSRTYTTE